jgi:hypothetical protein
MLYSFKNLFFVDGEKTKFKSSQLRQFRSLRENENLTFFAGRDQLKHFKNKQQIFKWSTFRCGAHASFIGKPSDFASVLLYFKGVRPNLTSHSSSFYTDYDTWRKMWFNTDWACRVCQSVHVSTENTHAALHVLKHISVCVCGVCFGVFSNHQRVGNALIYIEECLD